MDPVNCLQKKNPELYDEIAEEANDFLSRYGKSIIHEDIFRMMSEYTAENEWPLELLRYPVWDSRFCACTFLRGGRIFLLVNTAMTQSEQIFAAAHELYYIYRFLNFNAVKYGTVLTLNIDRETREREDFEANAFACSLLVPASVLSEQIKCRNLEFDKVILKDIFDLMGIFSVPYNALVMRLYEEGHINQEKVQYLQSFPQDVIDVQVKSSGIDGKWTDTPSASCSFGSLLTNFRFCAGRKIITDEQAKEDKEYIRKLMERCTEEPAVRR